MKKAIYEVVYAFLTVVCAIALWPFAILAMVFDIIWWPFGFIHRVFTEDEREERRNGIRR